MKRRLFTLAAASAALAACAPFTPAPRVTYVLVHGAFQDERAWSEIKPRLEAAGHRVVTVQLAGRGSQPGPVEQISLNTYRDQVAAVVRAQPGPVVLVGHSFGGITISAVAEAVPEKVRTLVYVAAYLPAAGLPDQSMAKLAESDKWNAFNKQRQNFILAKDYKTAGVLEDDIVMLFCGDCSPADQQRTKREFFQREPLAPAATPVQLTAARFGQVDKVYIRTALDRAISPQLQDQMLARTPVRKVVPLQAGHSPFLSQPEALANALLAL